MHHIRIATSLIFYFLHSCRLKVLVEEVDHVLVSLGELLLSFLSLELYH